LVATFMMNIMFHSPGFDKESEGVNEKAIIGI